MQRSSRPPTYLLSVSTHVIHIPCQTEVIQPSRCQISGAFLTHSLAAVTQDSFHYPAFTPLLLSQTEVLREYRCRIIIGELQLYESMEHAANITPCNTLPRQHPHICP